MCIYRLIQNQKKQKMMTQCWTNEVQRRFSLRCNIITTAVTAHTTKAAAAATNSILTTANSIEITAVKLTKLHLNHPGMLPKGKGTLLVTYWAFSEIWSLLLTVPVEQWAATMLRLRTNSGFGASSSVKSTDRRQTWHTCFWWTGRKPTWTQGEHANST